MSIGLLLVYFGYGLAFWAMGLAVLLESGRVGPKGGASALRWLSAFGLLHGTHEWLEAFLLAAKSLGTVLPAWLSTLRLGFLAVSFGCLLAYGLTSLRSLPPVRERRHWRYPAALFAVLLALVVIGGVRSRESLDLTAFVDAALRYAVAVPAAALAAIAAWAASWSREIRAQVGISHNLRIAGVGFAAYGLTQLFVHQQAWFPANVLSRELLLLSTGLPIEAIRGIIAGAIAIALMRSMQAAENARLAELLAAHQARLAALEQQDTLRRDLLRHIVRSQEAERTRIARELHDDVAQFLSAFSLQLGRLHTRLRGARASEIVDQLQDLSHQMSQSLHRLVRDLRPSHLDNLGLVPAIRYLLNEEYGPQGLEVTFNATGQLGTLPGPVDTALFRVVQESLTNVVRHAGVSSADVLVHYEPHAVTLRICDQGAGFDISENFLPPRGWGLVGMRERVEALGGHLSLKSGPSRGTTVEAYIPLPGNGKKGSDDEEDQTPVGR